MPGLVRFGVSLEEDLLVKFDRHIKQKKYTNRSEAIRDMIREELVRKEWTENKEVTGAITLVYDHHTRESVSYTHLRAHETVLDLVCRLLLETKKTTTTAQLHQTSHNQPKQQHTMI